MNNSYNEFAGLYDILTYDVDYDGYIAFLKEIFKKHSFAPKLMLDLACGTGTLTKKLFESGYDMIGIDSSVEMLDIARGKCDDENDILFLNQDMTEFELYGTVDAIVSALDSINYLYGYDELFKVLKLAQNYLNYDGLFIFDINSEYKLTEILGNNTFVYEFDDIFYTWENECSGNSTTFYLNFFSETADGKYERIEETHRETIFKQDEIIKLINRSGLKLCGVYGGFDFSETTDKTERLFFVCKKQSN